MTPTEMHIDALMEKIEKLEAENARYREALEYYASERNWNDDNVICVYDVIDESDRSMPEGCCDWRGGRRAREALKGE
jgi:hypothetical protein